MGHDRKRLVSHFEPERALESFELAHELEHEDPGAVLGLSGTWWVLGRFELAESVLAEHWQLHQNLVLGAELARVQVNRGHRLEAQQTLSALMEAHANGADRPVPLPPEPLPILPLTSGRQPESRPNELAPAPLGPPRFPEVDMGGVRAYVYNPTGSRHTWARVWRLVPGMRDCSNCKW